MDAQEAFENSFWYFVSALRVLSHEPERQCKEMEAYNAGWEIKQDVIDFGQGVVGSPSSYLTKEQTEKIIELIAALKLLPAEAVPHVAPADLVNCIASMNHPAWVPVRQNALRLLVLLESNALRNEAYFHTRH